MINGYKIKAKDKIYFCWIPKKTTEQGWKWLTWICEDIVSVNDSPYQIVGREHYRYTKYWFFRSDNSFFQAKSLK